MIEIDLELVKEKYLEGKNLDAIAADLFVAKSTLQYRLTKAGIKLTRVRYHLIYKLAKQGKRIEEIYMETNISKPTIYQALKVYNMKLSDNYLTCGCGVRIRINDTICSTCKLNSLKDSRKAKKLREQQICNLRLSGKSVRQISILTSYSEKTIYAILHRNQIWTNQKLSTRITIASMQP